MTQQTDNEKLGMLVIPSLDRHGNDDFIHISKVSKEEAVTLVNEFTSRTVLNRKTKVYHDYVGQQVDHLEFYSGVLDLEKMYDKYVRDESYLSSDLRRLKISDHRGIRGRRAVFLSDDGTVGIGTTVIYNRNWATINFSDDTVLGKLMAIQKCYAIDSDEDADEESDSEYTYDSSDDSEEY